MFAVQDTMSLAEESCLPYCRPDKPCNAAGDCPYGGPTADYGAAASSTVVSDPGHHLACCHAASESAMSWCVCRHTVADKKDARRRRRSRRILGALKPSCFAGKEARPEPGTAGSRPATAAAHAWHHLEDLGTTSLSIREQEDGRCYGCPCVNKLYQRQAWAASQSSLPGAGVTGRPKVEIPQTSTVLPSAAAGTNYWDGNAGSATFAVMVILSGLGVGFALIVLVSQVFFT